MKKIPLTSTYFIFPVTLLALFQFIAIALSVTGMPFTINLLLSLAVATILARSITLEFSRKSECTPIQLGVAIVVSAIMAFIYALRMNKGIADFTCPTGILGLITQISEGRLPVSYQSFPEFPMNYHQGLLLIIGIVTAVLKIPVAASTKIVLSSCYFFLNMGVMLFFVKNKNQYFFLPSLLFLFTGSANPLIYDLQYPPSFPRISILDLSTGNSWPLTLLLLTVFFFIAKEYTHSRKHILFVALLLLSLSTLNALVFQIMILGLASFYGLFLIYIYLRERRFFKKNLMFSYILGQLVFLIPTKIPSAFITGEVYGSPHIALRFLALSSSSYLGSLRNYFFLVGPLPLLTFIILIFTLKKRSALEVLLLTLLAISITFPVIFTFTNVIEWDMMHKFSLFSMFVSTILITFDLKSNQRRTTVIFILLFMCAFCSSKTTQSFFTKRISTDFTSSNEASTEITDVVSFLSSHKTLLIPYRHNEDNSLDRFIPRAFCPLGDRYSEIAQYSDNFIRDSYETNFLLSDTFEYTYNKSSSWNNFQEKAQRVATELHHGATLIVDKKRLDQSHQKTLENILQAQKYDFPGYLLYRTEPW